MEVPRLTSPQRQPQTTHTIAETLSTDSFHCHVGTHLAKADEEMASSEYKQAHGLSSRQAAARIAGQRSHDAASQRPGRHIRVARGRRKQLL